MPEITDIRPQKNRHSGSPRFNIFLDGQFSFALPAETLVKAGLKIDQRLSQKEIEKLIKENEFIKVYDWALRFLSFRPRSEKELEDWFKRKEVGEETQRMVREKLKHLGYINDEEFVKWWLEQRTTFRPMGRRAIEMELRQKGVSNEMVSSIKYQVSSEDETGQAKRAAEKKIELWKNLPADQFRQKLTSFLLRRGFSWEVIDGLLDKFNS